MTGPSCGRSRESVTADALWSNAVVYQIYPRSFQDSNGDGIGDLRGIASRLDHVRELGADAVWLSPIYPSPNADFGYDVSDYDGVDPAYGTIADFDALVEAAHATGLRLLLDLVPCHTSIEHPWFRERPDFYFLADRPLNNWAAAFGGTSWSRDELSGRWYLHSFFPEQADLNWRNPEVRERMGDVIRTWLGRGADGFRIDAIDRLMKDEQLRDDPPAAGPPPLPLHPEHAALEHMHATGKAAWVLSNHDFSRLPNRVGRANDRAAAMLLLTLPGPVFIFQGDEIGIADGPGHNPPLDRHGRDAFRHPMQWDPSPDGGFSDGSPWLPSVDPDVRNVADQTADRGSLLWLYRDLIALRRTLAPGLSFRDGAPVSIVYERGDRVVAINLGDEDLPGPEHSGIELATTASAAADPTLLPAHSGWIASR